MVNTRGLRVNTEVSVLYEGPEYFYSVYVLVSYTIKVTYSLRELLQK